MPYPFGLCPSGPARVATEDCESIPAGRCSCRTAWTDAAQREQWNHAPNSRNRRPRTAPVTSPGLISLPEAMTRSANHIAQLVHHQRQAFLDRQAHAIEQTIGAAPVPPSALSTVTKSGALGRSSTEDRPAQVVEPAWITDDQLRLVGLPVRWREPRDEIQ